MAHFYIIVSALCSLMLYSFGFTMDRSALVLSAWDTAPSLYTYQKVLGNPVILKNKTQMTTNKILQMQDAKMSEKKMKNQTREKRLFTENIDTEKKLVEMKPINEIVSPIANDVSNSIKDYKANTVITPRNVILLLIDEKDRDEKKEKNWKNYKERLPFAIEGFLQSCRDKFERTNFSINNIPVSETENKINNCECVLHLNIEELLSWAKQMMGMATGVVSDGNSSISFFSKHEFSRSSENNVKLESRKDKHDITNELQVINLADHVKPVSSLTINSKIKEEMNHDVMWNIFDMFSKIRMVFFRSLIESLHRNDIACKDEILLPKSFAFKQTMTNLIKNTIRQLKSASNSKGYMLIAAVPKNEGNAVIDFLQRQASSKNTLLIVMQICIKNRIPIPFIAQGPNCRILQKAKIIDELPILIKKAIITRDCYNTECTNRQKRDVPIVSYVSREMFSQEQPVQKRIIINKNAEKPNIVGTEETIIRNEIQEKSSTSLKTIPCGLTTMLGVTTSIFIKAAITHS